VPEGADLSPIRAAARSRVDAVLDAIDELFTTLLGA
jgi:hypothetical protein